MSRLTLLLLFVSIALAVSYPSDDHDREYRGDHHRRRDYHDYHDPHDHHYDHDDHHDGRDHRDDDYAASHEETEGDVIRELKSRHANHGVPESDGPLDVGLGLFVESVTEVNEEKGFMELSGFLSIRWVDPRLRFRYSHPFHEVHDVRLSRDDVWLPDIELYNSVEYGVDIQNTASYSVVVEFNGTVKWFPMVSVKARCSDLDPHHDDEVHCELRFGSWTYGDNLIHLHTMQAMPALGQYDPSGEWIATAVASERVSVKYPCCPEPYSYLSFTLTLRKRAG